MMMTGLDHSPINLEDQEQDLQTTHAAEWVQSVEGPLFSVADLDNLKSQAAQDMGLVTS